MRPVEAPVASDVGPATFERYAHATAQLDDDALRTAIARSWAWGMEIAAAEDVWPFDASTLEALDERLAARDA